MYAVCGYEGPSRTLDDQPSRYRLIPTCGTYFLPFGKGRIGGIWGERGWPIFYPANILKGSDLGFPGIGRSFASKQYS